MPNGVPARDARGPHGRTMTGKDGTMTNLHRLAAGVTGAVILAATAWPATAQASSRTLDFYFTHTKQRMKITYKKNGKYIPSAMKKVNYILRDFRRNEPTKMDPKLIDTVWSIYKESGSRKPIHIISGYRSPKTNAALRRRGRKVARKSQHMRGKAMDFFLPDVSVDKLRAIALKHHAGGVGYYRGSFVHVDTGRVRHWPRMSRKQLARVFPKGRTIHVPSNGRPLKGYKIAAANLKKGLRYDGRKQGGARSVLGRLFRRDGSKGSVETAVAKAQAKKEAVTETKENAKTLVARAQAVVPTAKPTTRVEPAPRTEPATRVARRGPVPADPFAIDARRARDEARGVKPADARRPVEIARGAIPTPAVPTPASRPRLALAGTPNRLESFSSSELRSRAGALASRSQAYAPQTAAIDATEPGAAAIEALATGRKPVPADLGNADPGSANASRPAVRKRHMARAPQAAAPSRSKDIMALNRRIRESLERGTVRPGAAPAPSPAPANAPILTASLNPADTAPTPAPRAPRIDEPVAAAQAGSAKATLPAPSALPSPSLSDAASAIPSLASPRGPIASFDTDVVFVRTADRVRPVRFSIGDLYGRSIRRWATASTVRRGAFAAMRAPYYRSNPRLGVPATVFAQGFSQAGRLRTHAFTGKAILRVRFESPRAERFAAID